MLILTMNKALWL